MRKRLFLPALLLCCFFLPLLTLTGCWDRREPNFLGVVAGVAFDYDPQTGLLHVIAQVANPLGISGGDSGGQGGGGSGQKPFWVVESSGRTVYEAIKKMERISTKKLLWSHLEVVLFSEALAREGLQPVLDYIDRERQTRMIARPFVVEGDVRQLLEAEFPLEQLGGIALIRQLLTIHLEGAFTSEIDSLRRLFHHLTEPGIELILPRIEVQNEKKEAGENGGEGSKTETKITNPAKISGSALFRGDRLAGFLNEQETAGYLWLTNNIRRQTVILPCPGEEDKFLAIEIFGASATFEPQIQGENIRLSVFVRAEGRLQDYAGHNLPQGEEFKRSLNRRLATVIHNQIDAAWQKAHELSLDVFGFGLDLYQNRPRDWKRLENKWEVIFPEIDLVVDVRALIRNYGLITEPLKIR